MSGLGLRHAFPARNELVPVLFFILPLLPCIPSRETPANLLHFNHLLPSWVYFPGLGTGDPGFDFDGRRPREWCDALENLIVGEWAWEEGKVSGVERGQVGRVGPNVFGAIYNAGMNKAVGRSAAKEDRGVSVDIGITPHDQFVNWGNDVPLTKAIVHVPGACALL